MRRVIIIGFALCFAGAGIVLGSSRANANELTDWMAEQTSGNFAPDDVARDDDLDVDDRPDPGASMSLKMHNIADRGLGDAAEDALNPCATDPSERRRLFCWSTGGRSHHIMLPAIAMDMVHALSSRTLYSYKTVDVRFPPSVRVRLPYNATSTIGYEESLLGLRLRWRF